MDEKAFVCRKCTPLQRYFGGTLSISETFLAKTTFTSVWICWWVAGISLRCSGTEKSLCPNYKILVKYLPVKMLTTLNMAS